MRKRKKADDHIQLLQGIYLKQPKLTKGQALLNGFLRSFIVFAVAFGSVGGFLSAFQIRYNYLAVALVYLLMAVFASMLYALPRLFYRDIGYILFFCVFIPVIYMLRGYANSGLYEIVNRILKQAELFFDLPGIVEYEVQIDRPYLTVSILAVFVGMMEILVLNIWIYITMGIGWTVFITFPILLLPIYMKQTPDRFFVVLLGAGYLAVMIFKSNGHYMSLPGRAGLRVKGRKKDKLSYAQDAGMLGQVLAAVFVLCFLVAGTAGRIVPQLKFDGYFKKDALHEGTSELVGNALMLGIGGLFNWYDSTGGIGGGRLGGVSGVRPDGQPDLMVSFAPYGNEAVYLKAYTGGIYGDNQWERIPVLEQDSLKAEAGLLEQSYIEKDPHGAQGKMRVKNVGASAFYQYFPYYTKRSREPSPGSRRTLLEPGIGIQQEETYTYYPLQVRDGIGQARPAEIDLSQVDAVFLDVPEKNRDILRKECAAIGLTEDMTELEMVDAIREYFSENIPYTLRPGATPRGEDFVNYFLTKNRKGYCAHFASAAVLLLRQMGIPARYVEGYAFSMETAFDSELNEAEQYADFFDGYAAIGESAVLDVEVTDAMAHAWVEVYMDGFGWCTAEMTPGRAEAAEGNDFWSIFTSFLGGAQEGDGGGDGQMLGDIYLPEFSWMFYVAAGGIAVCFLWYAGCLVRRKVIRYNAVRGQDVRAALIAGYADVCDMERLAASQFDACRSHTEQICYFCKKYGMVVSAQQVGGLLEKISFSRAQITESEQKQIAEVTGAIGAAIYKAAGVRQKIRLFLR